MFKMSTTWLGHWKNGLDTFRYLNSSFDTHFILIENSVPACLPETTNQPHLIDLIDSSL